MNGIGAAIKEIWDVSNWLPSKTELTENAFLRPYTLYTPKLQLPSQLVLGLPVGV